MSTPTNIDEDDAVHPLLHFDTENAAWSTSSHRPTLRPRRLSGGMNSTSYTNLRRAKTRKFSTSSIDELFPPQFDQTDLKRDKDDEEFERPSSSSKKLLSFFALPVLAGVFFDNGASVAVDLILIGLACLCLYWSVEIPWQWYFYARTLAVEEGTLPSTFSPTEPPILEDDESEPPSPTKTASPIKTDKLGHIIADSRRFQQVNDKKEWRTLHNYELYALSLCFLAPPVVAYVLHKIREYLARPEGSPIENASLILFVMAAELPPLNQACKLLLAHTIYLQRVVASYDVLEDDKVKQLKVSVERKDEVRDRVIEEMSRSIADMQERLANPTPPSESRTPTSERSEKQNNSTQMQLDALNRAVRRYEKRAITQALVYEARLKDLDARINDALTLAAAASRSTGSKVGFMTWILDIISHLLMLPITLLHTLFSVPATALGKSYTYLLGPRRKAKRSHVHTLKTSDTPSQKSRL